MLHITLRNRYGIAKRSGPKRLPYEQVWHLWTVVIPRRSITGRLLWGTVWRRRDDDHWIYKQYLGSPEAIEHRQSVRTLISESNKRTAR